MLRQPIKERIKMNKVLHARIEASLIYRDKISIHSLDGKSLRDQILNAGFEDGDEVFVITKEYFEELKEDVYCAKS